MEKRCVSLCPALEKKCVSLSLPSTITKTPKHATQLNLNTAFKSKKC
jgi:hypothetical protein